MEKVIVGKLAGEILSTPRRPGASYKILNVDVELDGRTAEFTFDENFDNKVKIKSWFFKDVNLEQVGTVQNDLSAFEALGITVDLSSVYEDLSKFLKEESDKEEKEKEIAYKKEREQQYDSNYLIKTFKPSLENKGYSVTVNYTKQEYVEKGYDLKLYIDKQFTAGYNWQGWFEVGNGRDPDYRITKKTKSVKHDKILALFYEVVADDKALLEREKRNNAGLNTAKYYLESAVMEEVISVKDWHSNSHLRYGNREGYYDEYFIRKSDRKSHAIKFYVHTKWDGKTHTVEGVTLQNIPSITDPAKLKSIVKLLGEK